MYVSHESTWSSSPPIWFFEVWDASNLSGRLIPAFSPQGAAEAFAYVVNHREEKPLSVVVKEGFNASERYDVTFECDLHVAQKACEVGVETERTMFKVTRRLAQASRQSGESWGSGRVCPPDRAQAELRAPYKGYADEHRASNSSIVLSGAAVRGRLLERAESQMSQVDLELRSIADLELCSVIRALRELCEDASALREEFNLELRRLSYDHGEDAVKEAQSQAIEHLIATVKERFRYKSIDRLHGVLC